MDTATPAQVQIKDTLGRFQIVRLLGEGTQSEVFLAFDPRLQREVAIKTLHVRAGHDGLDDAAALLHEARTVSKLKHAHIVPIFEVGEHAHEPYLVFEYVQGGTLADVIEACGTVPVPRALFIAQAMLDALAYAHANDVIHRDLKPANILIAPSGTPRLTDFGIALRGNDSPYPSGTQGTPAYIAPECLEGRSAHIQSDVFAAGMVLYCMLTGKPVMSESDINRLKFAWRNVEVAAPSTLGQGCDAPLDAIVLKALERNPKNRYQTATAFKQAIDEYLAHGVPAELSKDQNHSTLDFLLRRMRLKSDFPAMSEAVRAINRITSSERESVSRLSNTILNDFALTNKLLKLVNSAFYSRSSQTCVSTVSRAVVVLGFDAVRNIALTLMLFEHLQSSTQTTQLRDEFMRALFNGLMAKELAYKCGVRDAEEAFICAMFHNLGRLLALYYFPEESDAIAALAEKDACSEAAAASRVLGCTYEALGVAVAKNWGFPGQIVASMQKPDSARVHKGVTEQDKLRILASLTNEIGDAITAAAPPERHACLRKIFARYEESMSLNEKQLAGTIEKTLAEIARFGETVARNSARSLFLKRASELTGKAPEVDIRGQSAQAREPAADGAIDSVQLVQTSITDDRVQDAQTFLTAGLQDISAALAEDGNSLNDILRMVLEAFYRGVGFHRVMLCLKDGRTNTMNGRFGFGDDIGELIKAFKIPLGFSPDVFHLALSKGADILITDIDEENIRHRVPDWYRKRVLARTFVLFPLIVRGGPVALIYGDKRLPGEIALQEKELGLLKALRNQAVLALKQTL